MIASGRSGRRGIALWMVLAAAFVVFGALGFAIRSLAVSAAAIRHETAKAEARALALGAWTAAKQGLAESGTSFAGFQGKALGRGTIAVEWERRGGELVVKASSIASVGSRIVRSQVNAVVRVDDSKPAGEKLVQVAEIRLE